MIPGKGIYDRAPLWAQTLAVNYTAARGYPIKYGRTFHKMLETLAANETKSLDELLADQRAAVRRLLHHAKTHVPFYRRKGGSPDSLADWPIIDRTTIAAHPEDFIPEGMPRRGLIEARTSGTSGTPLVVHYDRNCYQTEMAFRWRHKAWAGVPFLSSCAYVSGHPVVPSGQTRPPFWRLDRIEKRLLCSSYHMAPDNLPSYLDAIARWKPAFVHGYPSSLYLLATEMIASGRSDVRPHAVFTSSETLLDFQRETIERAFGTRVFDFYGNTEFACNMMGCPSGRLHQRTDYGVLEILDDGAMICTGLTNSVMPLIRYRVGDRASAAEGRCDCGRAFPLIERIEGRIEDYVRTPDGRLVGRLDHLFKDVQHVREAQIVQSRLEEIVLRIVRAEGYSAADEKIVLREARDRLGPSVMVRFEYVDSIARTANGKFRFIVSSLPREQTTVSAR